MEDQLVTVVSFFYPNEAGVPRSLLESEGIECFIFDENTISVHPFYSNAIGGIRLQVRESDAQRAAEILKEGGFINEEGKKNALEKETTEEKPFNGSTCPYCGSDEIVKRKEIAGKSSILASMLLLSIVGSIPFLFYRRKYHCMDCGQDFKKNKIR
jgi:DNA-directed RNA polymerase subunit RPC12/RpoP